jgi:hypothetical protein
MADPQTDAAIAKLWPERWAKATSKGRNNLRRSYKRHLAIKALPKYAKCGNCKHLAEGPSSLKWRPVCALGSGSGVYQLATASGICEHWDKKGGAS